MRAITTWLIAGILVTLVSIEGGWAATSAADPKGPAIYRALAGGGALDDYLKDLVAEVMGQLVRVAREWPGYQVNGPYKPAYVNVYLIDSKRLSGQKLPVPRGINLTEENLAGSAWTDEDSATIFVDTGMLKEYLASVMRKLDTSMPLLRAVAEVRAQGLDNVRPLWDPAANPRLNVRVAVDNWLNFYRGMLGFVLAHELGHIHMGRQAATEGTDAPTLADKRDMDLRWACWDALSAKFRSQQQVEARADRYAARLIAQVLFPEGALRAPLLWYELGAQTYLLYTLNAQFLSALDHTESNYLRRAMQIQLGSELYARLTATEAHRRRGALHVLFPMKHPASVTRVEQLLDTLGQSPYSYHHQRSSYGPELAGLRMVIDPACAELKRKYGIP
jgi:hypothetical protein